jgi:hypothetical protein
LYPATPEIPVINRGNGGAVSKLETIVEKRLAAAWDGIIQRSGRRGESSLRLQKKRLKSALARADMSMPWRSTSIAVPVRQMLD